MTNYRRALLRVIYRVYGAITVTRRISPAGRHDRPLRDFRIRASQPMRFISFSLPCVLCQSRTVAASIIRKGLLERVSCDLHSYPVALRFASSPPRFQKENASRPIIPVAAAARSYIWYFSVRNVCTCTHKPTRVPPGSIIGCGDNPCYRNVPPARKLSNAAAPFCSVLSVDPLRNYQ